MAIEYRMTLACGTPVELLAERAFPAPEERPTGAPPLLSATLFDRYGFQVHLAAGENGYLDADGWEWKPPAYVSINFRFDKFADREWVVTNMITAVRRVLTTGPEDAAFIFNGDVLLLTRFYGN